MEKGRRGDRRRGGEGYEDEGASGSSEGGIHDYEWEVATM